METKFDNALFSDRINMSDTERLTDIFRNGLSKEDKLLLEVHGDLDIDPFWDNNYLDSTITDFKEAALERLVYCIPHLKPNMLSDAEIIKLVQEPRLTFDDDDRDLERNIYDLPKPLFCIVKNSDEVDRATVDYVNIVENGDAYKNNITPVEAYNSMDYFLSKRLIKKWDPCGADDEFGQVTGAYYFPNEKMKNPSEYFPKEMLTTDQWRELEKRHGELTKPFIPKEYSILNRIADVKIYPFNGNVSIRCKIDGEQQSSRVLDKRDAELLDYDTDIDIEYLAARYFKDELENENEIRTSMRR